MRVLSLARQIPEYTLLNGSSGNEHFNTAETLWHNKRTNSAFGGPNRESEQTLAMHSSSSSSSTP